MYFKQLFCQQYNSLSYQSIWDKARGFCLKRYLLRVFWDWWPLWGEECLKCWLQSLFSSHPLQTHHNLSSPAKVTIRLRMGICTARQWAMFPCLAGPVQPIPCQQWQISMKKQVVSPSALDMGCPTAAAHWHICTKCFKPAILRS